MKADRRIIIRDLRISAPIGLYDHERLAPQPIVVNTVLEVRDSAEGAVFFPEGEDPALRKVLCYATLAARLSELAQARHTDLVETLADAMLALCLSDKRVLEATLRIEKPDALEMAAGVGVEVSGAQR